MPLCNYVVLEALKKFLRMLSGHFWARTRKNYKCNFNADLQYPDLCIDTNIDPVDGCIRSCHDGHNGQFVNIGHYGTAHNGLECVE